MLAHGTPPTKKRPIAAPEFLHRHRHACNRPGKNRRGGAYSTGLYRPDPSRLENRAQLATQDRQTGIASCLR